MSGRGEHVDPKKRTRHSSSAGLQEAIHHYEAYSIARLTALPGLQRVVVFFTGADTGDAVEFVNEDFAVADFAGA